MPADLPHDVIYEILVWLPVKPLLRFRCVSKSWYSIINSREFIYSHLHTSSINGLHRKLILPCRTFPHYVRRLKLFRTIDINDGFREEFLHNFQMHDIPLKYTANCNGLVLFYLSDFIFSVWNPSTRHYRQLPDFPIKNHQSYEPNYSFGLGYDSTIDDYKVVFIIFAKPYYQVWIFELKSSCWRRIQDFSCIEFNKIEEAIDDNCFVDGCLHFLCYGNGRELYTIVSFDVAKETFAVISQPMKQRQGYYPRLGVFEGCLSISFFMYKNIDFYVRKKEGVEFSWIKLFSFASKEFNPVDFRALGYSKGGDKVLFLCSTDMFSYDLKDGCIREIEITNSYVDSEAIFCTESLVSVPERRRTHECEEEKRRMNEFERYRRRLHKLDKASKKVSAKRSSCWYTI
ncbi:F-box protein CPR1-like [Euphorbia lathyris]|uniref:F-box protein CPR1-like n=1 Tax=Euphorbia lathyris TaxID=212925 RepID=UPI003313963F